MISFPNAKINLGLQILGKREDGYHNLQSVFYPVAVKDILEVIPREDNQVIFHQSGLKVDGTPDQNLCIRAYHLFKNKFPDLPGISVHLHKMIPMGAGMGGGSADGSFMIKMLNDIFALNLSLQELLELAASLGSDCPFFMYNEPCLALGRGEILEPINIQLSNYQLLIVHPGIHVHTGKAFQALTKYSNAFDVHMLETEPVENWRKLLINDFEEVVFAMHPEIAAIKTKMYQSGASYASMSGSGSSVYALFPKNHKPKIEFPENYFHIWV